MTDPAQPARREGPGSAAAYYTDTFVCPPDTNADHWAWFLSERSPEYAAVRICEMIERSNESRRALREELAKALANAKPAPDPDMMVIDEAAEIPREVWDRLGKDKPAPAADLVPMQGPGHPMKCLLCGGKTEEYCGPVVHHVDCKHYVAPDPNARKMTADEIDALMGFDKPAPAGDDLVRRLRKAPRGVFTDSSGEPFYPDQVCHQAADELEAAQARNDRLAAAIRDIDRACNMAEVHRIAVDALASEGSDRG